MAVVSPPLPPPEAGVSLADPAIDAKARQHAEIDERIEEMWPEPATQADTED